MLGPPVFLRVFAADLHLVVVLRRHAQHPPRDLQCGFIWLGGFAMKRISELPPKERRDLLQFDFRGGPLEDPTGCEKMFYAFGLAIMAWARLEIQIEALLIQINKKSISAELFDPKHPISFSRKLRLLKKWFGRHKLLAEHSKIMDSFITRMRKLSALRNDYFHALLSVYDAKENTVTLRTLHYVGKDEFHIARREFGPQQLVSFAAAATRINNALWEITRQLFTEDALERLRKS